MRMNSIVVMSVVFGTISGVMLSMPDARATQPTITDYGCIPARIDAGGLWQFWCTYTQAENLPPTTLTVKRSIPLPSGSYNMVKNNTGDTDYTDGCLYYYNWYFYDYITAAQSLVITCTLTGETTVTKMFLAKSSIPFPEFRNVVVTETAPGDYTFSGAYYNLMNYPPVAVKIAIDGTFYNMVANDSSTNYFTGKSYHYNATLEAGDHTYQFFVDDQPALGNVTNGIHLLTVEGEDHSIDYMAIGAATVMVAGGSLIGFLRGGERRRLSQ